MTRNGEDLNLWLDMFAYNKFRLISDRMAEKLCDGCFKVLGGAEVEDSFPSWTEQRENEAVALYKSMAPA